MGIGEPTIPSPLGDPSVRLFCRFGDVEQSIAALRLLLGQPLPTTEGWDCPRCAQGGNAIDPEEKPMKRMVVQLKDLQPNPLAEGGWRQLVS